MKKNLPDFDVVNDALHGVSHDLDAAELHGLLCGMVCARGEVSLTAWLQPALPEKAVTPAQWPAATREIMQELLASTLAQINGSEFGFRLLLPGDDAGLAARLEALGNWCQGFLLGISEAGIKETQALPGELPEIITDILNIARAGDYELDDENEDEAAYMELVEYVRVGVQLFSEEMAALHANNAGMERPLH